MNQFSTLELKDIRTFKQTGKALTALLLLLFLSANILFAQSPSKTSNPNGKINPGQKVGATTDGGLTKLDDNSVDALLKKYDREIYFTQNKGQWKGDVLYRVDFPMGQALATSKGMLMGSFDPASVNARTDWMMEEEQALHDGKSFNKPRPNLKGHGWLMNFVGASPAMTVTNKDGHKDTYNYFVGPAANHATDVQSFNEVWYNNVYKNIDVRYYPSAEGQLEYDIIVNPGAKPENIAIKFDGIDKMELTREGHLVLNTTVGQMDLPEPYAYQMINGKEAKVEATYAMNASGELTFNLGEYDSSKPLIIDPIALRWATWITNNSSGDNHGHGLWVDNSGNIYIVARIDGSGLITVGAFDGSANGSVDCIIGKYTEPASVGGAGVRVWQTYVGGGNSDNPYVTELGPDGNLYFAGITSSGFPLSGGSAFGGASGLDYRGQGGDNVFIAKINAAGNSIEAAVIGGGGTDNIYDMRITSAGDLILGGLTTSTNLSTLGFSGASNTNNGGNDAWLFKITQNLDAISWMRNFGGSGNEVIQILVNNSSNGDFFVAGTTASTSGITAGTPRQSSLVGSTDGFLRRYNSSGTVQWGSYFNSLSGSTATSILCMEFNQAKDAVYFGGMTSGLATANISASGTYDKTQNGNRDYFVAKMALDQTFAYSTYVGSSNDEDNMMGLNTDANDDVYVFGYTYATGTNFPTAGNPLQSSSQGNRDKVFFKLKTDLSTLQYSTYYGGSEDDDDPIGERGIKFANCRIYTIITSKSNNLPLTNGAITTSRSSGNSVHEPGLVVWANPPDLINNAITPNQNICSGGTPAALDGQTPSYVLPTIIRNTTTSAHPSVGSVSSYQWQKSTDGGTTWVTISGATGEDLSSAQMGALTQTTVYRRIINGDYCVVSAQSNVTVKVFTISAADVDNTCFGGTAGSITITPTDGTAGYQYQLGSGAFQSGATFSGLAAGTYTVNAKDANNCTASVTVTITQPSQIAFTLTPSNATCSASNGSIVVSGVSGGSGSGYTYSKDGTTYQGGTTFSSLAAGTYTIYVKDGAGCVRSQTVTVSSANALVASISTQINVLCRGNSTGSVTVSQTGGTSPYTYSKDGTNFVSGATFGSLAAGNYTFTVKDANGCTATISTTITQPAANLSVSITGTTNASCGASNGSLTAAGAGGTSPYTYSKDGTNFQSSGTFSSLAGGSYTITVKDFNGCTSTVSGTVNNNAGPTASIGSQTNVLCRGNSTGSVTVSQTGGTSPFTYSKDGTNFVSGATFGSLAAGNYTFTVKDANGCTATISTTITQPAAVLAGSISSQTNVDCRGNSTGSVTVSATGGTSPYTYSKDGTNFVSGATFGSLASGNYTITIKDANGCTTTVPVNISQPAANLSVSISGSTNAACGGSNGSLTAVGAGGTSPYTYSKDGTNFQPAGLFSGLAGGSYTITVKDANGCTSTVSGTVNNNAGPTASISSQTNVDCRGNSTGSVTVSATGGTSPYTYSKDGTNFVSGATFGSLASGNYTITIKDVNGCITTVPVNITQPAAALSASSSNQVNVLCFGNSTGSVQINGAGGTSPYTYQQGSGAFVSTNSFTGLAAGTYSFTVKDANNCTSITSVTITQPAAALSASSSNQVNVLCFGNSTGSVQINGAGGTSPYTYQLGSGAFVSTNSFTGLAAGTYSFTVKDANNCTSTTSVTITQPAGGLVASSSNQVNVLCFGNSTGSVQINGAGGTSPYTYQLGSGAFVSTNSFTGLAAGTYSFTVKDANNCTSITSVTITQPAGGLVASSSNQVNVLCFGNSTGSVQINGAGGTSPYTYQLGSGAFVSTNSFTGLAAGTYSFTVKDANNCTSITSVTITQPAAALSASSSNQVNVLCFGNSTGSVQINGAGGTSPYTYQLGSGAFVSTNSFTGLAAGTYSFTVKDANNCTSTTSVTITQPAGGLVASSSNQVNVLCFGNSTGSVQINGAGGTSPYTYQLGSGAFVSTNSFTGLAAGTYSFTVKDANNCTSITSVTITQPAGGLVVSSSNQVNVLCFGNSTGSVQINGTGGTSPYTYQQGSGAFVSTNSFTGLAAGTYSFTVKDANNCTSTTSVTITQPSAPLAVSISNQTNVACNGGVGSVVVAATGGTTAYQYKIGSGSYQSSGTFSGLNAGTYTVTAQDANGCTATVSVTITQPSGLSVSVSNQINVLCFGNSTGAVTVTGTGGSTPYQFQINGGSLQSGATFTGLAAGTYTVTIKDANNCTSSVNVLITQPSAPLSGSISSQTDVFCRGNSTGAVTILATGGTAAYQYKIGNGALQNSPTFSGLAAGTYVVTIQDVNGCQATVNVTITQPANPLAGSIGDQTNVLCFGQSTGSVTISATGGTPSYLYKIGSGTYQSSDTFNGLAAGTYTVTIQDSKGCTTTVSVVITQPAASVTASLVSQTNVLCRGNNSGVASASATGGVAPYTFAINGGSYQTSGTFTSLTAGTYTITAKDANGCTSNVVVTITQPSAPLGASSTQVNASCAGSTNGSITITATGGTAPYQYKLGNGTLQSSNVFSNLSAATYVVTAQDANGCTFSFNVTISELSSTVSGSIVSSTNVLCYGAATGAVTVAGSGGVTPYQYSINGGTYQSGTTFSGLVAGNYFVSVKDANGCLGTITVTISQPPSEVSGSIQNQVNVLCFGGATGAVTIVGSGGVGPYQYKIGSGSYQSTGIFTALTAGSYVVTVKDNNGCTATVNVTITQPSSPVAGSITNQSNVLCFGLATGSATVVGSGGTAPYQYNISGGSFSASNVFSNLAAGTYTVVVKDANGCTVNIGVTITQPSTPVSGTITSQTNADCNGNLSGSVTVAGSGGTAPYQYSLNGGAFQQSGFFGGLASGAYTVIVKDANGCTFNVPVNISQPSNAVTASISGQTNVSCYGGNNGAVTVSGAGGTPGYTYSFNGGAFSAVNSFNSLAAGSYSVTVKDANGCTFVVTVNITQPTNPLSVAIASQTNVSCFGGSNGSVTVIGAGGTSPYVFKIGSGAYSSNPTFSNLIAGTYTITIRDSKLCTSTVVVTITQPSSPVAGAADDIVPVGCYGDASGSFTVLGSGGVAPYTYSFNSGTFNSSNSYVGLVAGTYTVVVKDANGCTSPAVSVTITQPNGPLSGAVGTQTNVLCYGSATGAFTVVANGGTAPYQYSINGGLYNSSNSFTGLTAGVYLVVVRDFNGCTSSPVQVTITQPNSAVSASITSSTNVLCFGAATGSATVVSVGGVQPYAYLWNTTPAQTGATASGLLAGTYTVTVTDNNGCSVQRTVTIAQPATPISASITNVNNVSCRNGNNGSATVTASGGTGVLSYSWNTSPAQNTATATNLTAGNYIVTVTDANGCNTAVPVTITQPATAVSAALVSLTNVQCYNDNNGSATISASGGTGNLSIIWNTSPQQVGVTAVGLTPGTYIASVHDSLGCFASVSVTITGPSQPLNSSIISSSNVTCYGFNNGSASVSATGGTFPYSYSWSTSPVQTAAMATGLAPGTYTVIVRDANNCITSSTITITGPAAPVTVAITNVTPVACRGDNSGSATASASGGTGSLNYTWNTLPAQTGPTATGLVAGTYIVTVTDAFGCSSTATVTITQPATVLTASLVNSVNPTCFGSNNGSATVTASGGNGPYAFVWNTVPQQTGPTATGLTAGNYVAAVTDQNGCTRFVNVTLTQPLAAMSGSIINYQNVLCYGESTGSATVSVSGGTAPYTYSWNSVPAQVGSAATGLAAGTYVVTVTDAQGCSIQRSVTITQPATPISVALVNQSNVTCYGFNNGSATVTASGGTGALSYVWNTVPQQVGTSATNLVAGTYVVTVTDAFNCQRTLTVTITQPAAPLSAVINTHTNVLCYGQATGSAVVTVGGGTPTYSYSWNTNPVQNGSTAVNLAAGTYIVSITDINGCTTTASTTITQPASPLNASITNSTNVLCYGNATGAATVAAVGGTPGYSYSWNSVPVQTTATATGLVAGVYTVTVTDNNGCSVQRTVTLTQPNAPLAATISNSVNVCPGFANGSATVAVTGGTTNYLYTWSTVPAQHNATATGLAAGSYTVTVTDANGCTTTAQVTITNNPLPAAGRDETICEKTIDLINASAGSSWSAATGNPAAAVINPTTGLVTGMNTGGFYLFILTNSFGCVDTISVFTTANCPLEAIPDNATTNEDTPVVINVPGNDIDPDGNINNGSVVIVTQPTHGVVTVNPITGAVTYTPNPNYNGPDSFIYNICDTGLPIYCDTALVTINVTPVNDPPVANIDHANTNEDTPVVINVPGNDTDNDGNLDPTSVVIVDQPNNGSVTVDPITGIITYTPDPNFNGVDTLIYNICDTGIPVLCDTALVIINVEPVNDPPVANIDHANTNEDTPVVINVPGNDTDVDGNLDPTSVVIVDQPNNGSVTVDPVTGIITYTPDPNFNGVDTLIYNICDTGIPVLCDTALVIINVEPVNDPPVANIDHANTNEDTPVVINVPGNDTDVDGNLDPTSVVIVDQPNNGSVTVDPVTGIITYTPDPNFNGVDTLIYNICDTGIPVLCDTALVIINVEPVNDPPVANIDHANTNEDTPVVINVPGNDTDVDGNLDPTSVVIVDQPNNGSVTVDPITGIITYTPDPNFNGVDTLIYNICDTGIPVYCDTALVIINVEPVNDPPVANIDHANTNEDTPVVINVPGNDTDNDGNLDPTSVVIVDQPNNGSVTVDPITGIITYTPDPNFNGVDTLIYNICDTGIPVLCDTALVIINVEPVNDPPVANIDHANTNEDTPVVINVPGNDTDVDGNLDPTSVVIVDQPNNGSVTVDPVTGIITYTPDPNFNGVDTLIYNICDTGIPVYCDTALVIINVEPVNDPPVANIDHANTNEDTPVVINVPGNDTDNDGNLDPTSVVIVDQPNNGSVTVDPITGIITYTPDPNFNGVDTLIYNICDTGIPVLCDTALVIINVEPVNDPPVANIDHANTNEDTPVVINVPGNDTDVDGNLDPTSVVIVDQPNNGSVTVDPVTGIITYTPDPNFNGVDTLIYNICDTGIPVLCDTALVIINVEPVNDPPVANIDHANTNEDTPVVINVPGNDTDNDGNLDPTSVVIVDQPNNGSVTVDPVTGIITYTPDPNFNGVDTLIYNICDTGIPVYCDTALVIINVEPVNDPPVANIDHANTNEDTPVVINVPGNDTDVDGNLDPTSVVIVDQPNNGSVTVDPITGIITYTPDPNFNGVDTLIYNICDTGIPVLCDTALVIINVEPVNDPPVANIDHANTNEDTPVVINVPGNDTDNDGNLDPTSVVIVDQPNNGSVTVDPVTGIITYTPDPNFNGVDTLIYNICDTGIPVLCDTALVIINVEPVNDPPVANIDHANTNEDTPVVINVPGNDTDVDGNLDPTSVVIVDQPNNGSVTVDPVTGIITYTPDPNFNGVDTLIYNICDTGIPVYCDTALVIINVEPVNDPPVANIDHANTNEDTPVVINVPGNDTDNDGNLDPTSVVIVDQPNNGSVTVDPITGIITYTPDPNFNGVDTLIYNICDTGIPVLCDTALVIINVEPVNDPPVANLDTTSTLEDTPVVINVPGNDTDVDGNLDPTSVVIVDQPNNGSVTVDPVTGIITYTPDPNFNGVDTLIYNICDTGTPVYCDTAYVVINVGPVNDPPVAINDTAYTTEDTPVSINVDMNDYDVDGNLDTASVTIMTPPLFGSATYNPVTGEIDYIPGLNFFGVDSLMYRICDTGSPVYCDTAWVFIFIQSVPDISVNPYVYPSGTNISCFGANDGSIDLTVDPGTPPTTISWTGPNGFASSAEDISGLAPGTYTVVVTDGNGNAVSASVTLVEPSQLVGSGVALAYNGGYNISCGGGLTPTCDGSIDYTTTGGNAPYSFSWTGPGSFTANTEDISNLCIGTYTIVVTDVNGCTVTNTFTLTAPPVLVLNIDIATYNGGNNISCNNACDGSISMAVVGGVAPFTYSWIGPNGFVSTIEDLSNLCAGSYTIIVTDANGCSATSTITLTQPQAVTANIVAGTYNGGFNVSCSGACNGSVNLTVGGGNAPYTYAWFGPNGFVASTEDLANLCAGTYTVTVTDANGCNVTSTVILTAPTPVSAVAVAATTNGGTNISCNGACDGIINLSATGGAAPYAYSWIGPNGFVSTLEDLSNVCAGTYIVTVTDANGCTGLDTVIITEPNPVVVTSVLSNYAGGYNVSCAGASNGSIDITVTGGSGTYTYSWTGPSGFVANTQDVSNIAEGAYTVIVSDVNGCSDTLQFNITAPEVIFVSAVATPSVCGNANGSVTLTVTGGTAPFTYAWSGPNGALPGDTVLTNILGGFTYYVEVTDANGCSTVDTIFVFAKPPVVASGAVTPTACNGGCNGTIILTMNSGTAPYQYVWTGPNGFTASTPVLVNLCAGTYNVSITDINGCSATYSYDILAPSAINVSAANVVDATCSASNGSITLSVSGGTLPYTFSWIGPNGFTASTQNISGLVAGAYIVTVDDGNNCPVIFTVNVGSTSALASSQVINNVTCNGACNGTIDLTVAAAINPTFLWSNGANTEDLDSLCPGTYYVFITDANGCSLTDTVVITEPDPIVVAADILEYPNGYNVSAHGASDGSITLTVSGGTPNYTFLWTLVSDSTLQNQFDLPADTYNVVITDLNGCTLTEEYIITEPPLIELPTGFSPGNGDGMNDYYVIHGIETFKDNEFTVFNRWGQVIFNKVGYANDWAGTNFQGKQMPDGTYFILFKVNVPNEGEKVFKVTVELRSQLGQK